MGTKLLQKAADLSNDPAGRLKQTTGERPGITENKQGYTEIFKNLSDGIYNLNQVVTEFVEYTKTLKLRRSYQRIETILEETLVVFKDLIARSKSN